MENGRWKMENGRWKMEDGKWKMEDGRWCPLITRIEPRVEPQINTDEHK